MIENIYPIQSVYITNQNPLTNSGPTQILYVGKNYSAYLYRTLFKFDVEQFSKCYQLDNAKLYIYVNNRVSTVLTYVTPYLITEDWDISTLNWNNQPDVDTYFIGSTENITTTPGWYAFDVTNLVKIWLIQSPEGSLELRVNEEASAPNIISLYSELYTNPTYRPYIECSFIESYGASLNLRKTFNFYKEYTATNTIAYSDWVSISTYSTYTYFVENIGSYPVEVTLQMSPDQSAIVDDLYTVNILSSQTEAIVAPKYSFYIRLKFRCTESLQQSNIKVWIQAQV